MNEVTVLTSPLSVDVMVSRFETYEVVVLIVPSRVDVTVCT